VLYGALRTLVGGLSSSAREYRFAPRFIELMDLLLGWALEPSLPPRTRVALLSTFAADHVRAHWAANLEFSSRLAHKVRAVEPPTRVDVCCASTVDWYTNRPNVKRSRAGVWLE
jgi:hypothetical protein